MKSKSEEDDARRDESIEKYLNRNPYAADKEMAELYRSHRKWAYDAYMDHYRQCEKYSKK